MKTLGNILGNLTFGLLVGFLWLIAWLPLGVLYVLSDGVAFLLYHVVRYRRNVVRSNLTECFPDKTKEDIRRIERRFYRNFADYIFETIKLFHISDRQISRRMTFGNVELMDRSVESGKSVTVYFSHTGNWEWAPSVRLHSSAGNSPRVLFGQIYRPLRNKRMDALMLRLRGRFDTTCIAKATSLREFIRLRREDKLWVVGFMSDQKPSHGDPVRILSFFGRPTAVITGTETLARRLDTAVFFWNISKPRRGHYHIDVVPMAQSAAQTKPGELTVKYFELLENDIRRQPDLWLWTHKRWKTSPASWADVNPETLL